MYHWNGYEADDIINSYVLQALNNNFESIHKINIKNIS